MNSLDAMLYLAALEPPVFFPDAKTVFQNGEKIHNNRR